MIIYGLESNNVTESLIELFHGELLIECQDHDYRIVVPQDNEESPTVVEFVSNKLKNNILANARRVEVTSSTYLSTNEDYNNRKFLMSQQKLARGRGDTAYMKGHLLVVNGDS
ncbi:hypothetical protein JTB14_037139 [Gonioctena quinquepunctata]|nr:hypothetical protein JTB14_037139 [Gonioctena quinquepunctata]